MPQLVNSRRQIASEPSVEALSTRINCRIGCDCASSEASVAVMYDASL